MSRLNCGLRCKTEAKRSRSEKKIYVVNRESFSQMLCNLIWCENEQCRALHKAFVAVTTVYVHGMEKFQNSNE